MALLIRLLPSLRFVSRIASLQRQLGFTPDDADTDPGVVLGVVPDSTDLVRLTGAFDDKPVTGHVIGVAVQEFQGVSMTVVRLGGELAEVVGDFERHSMLHDLGASMALAKAPASMEVLDTLTEDATGTVLEFDRVTAMHLETGQTIFDRDLGEDNDTNDED